MATYKANGKVYEFPDDITDEEASQRIVADQSAQQAPATPDASAEAQPAAQPPAQPAAAPAAKPTGSIDPDQLQYDPDWVNASARLWTMNNPGKQYDGTREDMANYGLEQMSLFNYNLPKMALDAAQISRVPQEDKQAFLYLLETTDKLGYSVKGTGRFLAAAALDPTNYVGLSTFGLALAGKEGVRLATKEGVKALLRQGAVTGLETGIITGAGDAIRQQAEINAGGRTEHDLGQTLKAAGLGFVLGGALGGAVEGVGQLARGAGEAGVRDVPRAAETAAKDANPQLVPDHPDMPINRPEAPRAVEGETAGAVRSGTDDLAAAPREVPESATPVAEDAAKPSVATDNPPAEAASMSHGESDPRVTETAPIPEGELASRIEANPILKAVRDVVENSGLREYPRTPEALSDAAHSAVDEVLKLNPETAQPLIEEVRKAASTGEQSLVLKDAIKTATDLLLKQNEELALKLKAASDPTEKAALQAQLEQLRTVRDIVRSLDTDTSSLTGRELGARKGMTNTGEFREITPENLLKAEGLDPHLATDEQKAWAQNKFDDLLLQRMERARKAQAVTDVEKQIDQAVSEGRFADVSKLQAAKERLLADLMAKDGQGAFNKASAYLTEFVIGNVFSPKTVVMNTLPSLMKLIYKPALDALAKGPLDALAWRQAGAAYATMGMSLSTALKAGVAAFRYERGLLTQDFSKVLEHQPMFTKAWGLGPITPGSVVRFFPRVLQATDEVFAQLFYRAHVASEATANAYTLGLSKGFKGDALSAFVKDEVAKAAERSFAPKLDSSAVDLLYAEGKNRGLTGDKLDYWIKTELQKNGDLLRQATDEQGRRYADDALFKRKFDEREYGGFAAGYEQLVNRNPWMKLLGQLFFRTPVRVFEEGFRLTPGLNLINPSFLKDLAGRNGQMAQVRAHGEAMLSLGLGTSAMMLYASGGITGAGPDDPKVRKQWQQGGGEPYTIKVGNYKFSYRNLDPIATPIKILINTLEAFDNLHYRQAQGEFVNKSEFDQNAAYVTAAAFGILTAIKDANLMEGVSQLVEAGHLLTDPEGQEQALWKFIGQKLTMLAPSTLTKVQALSDPTQMDPFTLSQIVASRLTPGASFIPKRYDSLGNPLVDDNPLSGIVGLDITRKKDGPKTKADIVNEGLANLAVATNSSFQLGYKTDYLPGVDLRKTETADGKSTLYDKWNDKLRTTRIFGKTLTDALYDFLKESKGLSPEQRAEGVNKVLKVYRNVTIENVLKEDRNGLDQYIASKKFKLESRAGKFNPSFAPFQSN